jgi:hypothetical protein
MQPQVSNVTPIKPLTEDKSTPSGIFDMNETQFQALINRRSKNRLFFLNAIKRGSNTNGEKTYAKEFQPDLTV